MKIINIKTTDPRINLASEYYYLTNNEYKNDDLFLFWKNKNTIVIGKNQSFSSEVNQIYAKENNVNIVRRMSGGGAVFHDDGNICFTFIRRNMKNSFQFKDSLIDIINFFKSENINAEFSGRNDIIVNNKKVSGNAVMFYKNDYLIHGTLLFNTNIEKMVNLLTVDKSKLISKGIESVKSRVENIANLTNKEQIEFENNFISFFEKKYNSKRIDVDLTKNKEVLDIIHDFFGNNNWTYGRDFDFNYKNRIRIKNGSLEVFIRTEKNIIKEIEINSDGLLTFDISDFKKLFINEEYSISNITNLIKGYDLNTVLEDLTPKDVVDLFFNNK